MLPHRTILAPVLALALLTAGCGEVVQTLSDLRIVQNELVKRFGEEVTVHAANSEYGVVFTVWFINSALNNDTPEQRVIRAQAAAAVVKEKYPHIQKVREVWVGFLRKNTRFVVFHHTQMVSVHGFDRNGSLIPTRAEDRAQPPSNIQVTPSYDAKADVTDISVSGIQLEGQLGGFGLTVLPFFKVSGQTGAKRLPPPKTVQLNFASYAEKPKFEQTTPINFIADGQVVLKTEGTFTGRDAQFCYLTIPYKAFHRMVSGKELIIKLGDKEYPLTPSQLGAMKHMTEFVTE